MFDKQKKRVVGFHTLKKSCSSVAYSCKRKPTSRYYVRHSHSSGCRGNVADDLHRLPVSIHKIN
jgi:hypothetical protein